MHLNAIYAYAIEAQLCIELNGDGTGGFVQEFVDLLAFVVPDCRGSFHVWVTALTPDKSESEQFFTQFYILSSSRDSNTYLKDFIPCGESTCRFCTERDRGVQYMRVSRNCEIIAWQHCSYPIWW